MSVPVYINECSYEELLLLPMIGEKKALNILERRKTCPLTQESFLELIQRSELGPLEGRVSFSLSLTSPEQLRSHPQQVHMQRPMDLCDLSRGANPKFLKCLFNKAKRLILRPKAYFHDRIRGND